MVDLLSLAIGAAIPAAIGGLSWLARRRMTNEASRDQAALYGLLADLLVKMRTAGASLEEMRELERALAAGDAAPSPETILALTEPNRGQPAEEPQAYSSSVAIRARLNSRLAVLDSEIEAVRLDRQLLIDTERAIFFEDAHRAWVALRNAEASFAGSEFRGGTLEVIAGLSVAVSLSEEYLEQQREALSLRRKYAILTQAAMSEASKKIGE